MSMKPRFALAALLSVPAQALHAQTQSAQKLSDGCVCARSCPNGAVPCPVVGESPCPVGESPLPSGRAHPGEHTQYHMVSVFLLPQRAPQRAASAAHGSGQDQRASPPGGVEGKLATLRALGSQHTAQGTLTKREQGTGR